MPPVSKAQAGFMAMASTPKGRSKLAAEGKNTPPAAVAKEFTAKGKGSVKKLPEHVKPKGRTR